MIMCHTARQRAVNHAWLCFCAGMHACTRRGVWQQQQQQGPEHHQTCLGCMLPACLLLLPCAIADILVWKIKQTQLPADVGEKEEGKKEGTA